MTIKQQGGIFGRKPTFSEVTADTVTATTISATTANVTRVDASGDSDFDGRINRKLDFETGNINNTNQDVGTFTLGTGDIHIWVIIAAGGNGTINGVTRVYIYKDGSSDITSSITEDYDGGNNTVTVTDNGDGTYTMNVANNQANNKQYRGLMTFTAT